jgi:hypothetical protein
MSKYRHGAGPAEFLLCRNCGVLVVALYRSEDRTFAAVNANAARSRSDFGTELSASTKGLSGIHKVRRWRELWFPNVDFAEG